jgi:hypothetical protein
MNGFGRILTIAAALALAAPAATPARGHGSYHRSAREKRSFERMTGYPHGRPGYVVDHVVPLACGGADAPSNMQWQSRADAKAKDKVERRGCKRRK